MSSPSTSPVGQSARPASPARAAPNPPTAVADRPAAAAPQLHNLEGLREALTLAGIPQGTPGAEAAATRRLLTLRSGRVPQVGETGYASLERDVETVGELLAERADLNPQKHRYLFARLNRGLQALPDVASDARPSLTLQTATPERQRRSAPALPAEPPDAEAEPQRPVKRRRTRAASGEFQNLRPGDVQGRRLDDLISFEAGSGEAPEGPAASQAPIPPNPFRASPYMSIPFTVAPAPLSRTTSPLPDWFNRAAGLRGSARTGTEDWGLVPGSGGRRRRPKAADASPPQTPQAVGRQAYEDLVRALDRARITVPSLIDHLRAQGTPEAAVIAQNVHDLHYSFQPQQVELSRELIAFALTHLRTPDALAEAIRARDP